ncbi:HAD-superfamily hydrolase, subfamily IA, variant 1 [Kribbella flavida DSM 17836]|uniref:HAD-superfamily hydrolase, subfamily IA, variant 1 n=1 Tax=Kribbella flavida (strain DSM 17836 / JCM 10339 / NBRC 14399) TaxID=479435 RepID=D2PPY2_KRIFD|nr:HAD-IA family hydrolase [Kribbella flavida]ADB32906.1 HAD-superfamily hydrolase, subfamily IA, variant 1 [Kribbella flavida DSM 17836]
MGQLITPEALLLDFGGVLVATTGRPGWAGELAAELSDQLSRAGTPELTVDEIRTDLEAGAAADSYWKNAMSRPPTPRELTHREFWTDFVAADWPPGPRAWVTAHASVLCRRMGELRQHRAHREGIPELLDTAAAAGIPVGVVSNALSGAVHRDYLERTGLVKQLAVQIYSDEMGIRKPHPELILLAARALGVPVGRTWYVGDNFDRDVLCARRAGAGAAVLMEAPGTYQRPYAVRAVPDAIVPDPVALRTLLLEAL